MFNLSGSELIFILLLALVVLGPEKLPDAIRRFGRTYGEVRKVATGFQSELRSALDEPARELRETAEMARRAATFPVDDDKPVGTMADVTPSAPAPAEAVPSTGDDPPPSSSTEGAAAG